VLASELRSNNCHSGQDNQSSIRDLRMGISVGWGDNYNYNIDYQWLDVTSVPSGDYYLVNEANPNRVWREKSYANNASSILVRIQWPGGATNPPATITAPPTVQMLRSCPDSATCPLASTATTASAVLRAAAATPRPVTARIADSRTDTIVGPLTCNLRAAGAEAVAQR